jgi:protein-L-isoaspartate(D-aspartate) O-methyltransferase
MLACLLSLGSLLAWQLAPTAQDDVNQGGQQTDVQEQAGEAITSEGTEPERSGRRMAGDDRFSEQRRRMVQSQIRARGISDGRVLAAMQRVPRHRFVPNHLWASAHADHPLPIGNGQTISQPYIVALMSELVRPVPKAKALDVGTGSGYQAAVLAELCEQVYSIEIVKQLADDARRRLVSLGYDNVTVRCGDGYRGWPQQAPFDVIVVAAAPAEIPQPLLDQLAPQGRLVIPVGRYAQELVLVEKQPDGQLRRRTVAAVAFVPMTGKALRAPDHQPRRNPP